MVSIKLGQPSGAKGMVKDGISRLDFEPPVFAAGKQKDTNTRPTRHIAIGPTCAAACVQGVPTAEFVGARPAAPWRHRRRAGIGGSARAIASGNRLLNRPYYTFPHLIRTAPPIHAPGVNYLSRLVTADGLAAPPTLSRL